MDEVSLQENPEAVEEHSEPVNLAAINLLADALVRETEREASPDQVSGGEIEPEQPLVQVVSEF